MAQFTTSSLLVRLDKRRAIIRVARLNGFAGKGTATYVTVNGSAVAGKQYEYSSGTVSWQNAEGQPKAISVPLVNTGSYEPGTFSTSFTIRLTASSGLLLGQMTEATVTVINSNAATGTLSLANAASVVSESVGFLNLNVTRASGADCSATVSYRTVEYGARSSSHYGPGKPSQAGIITWADGDSATKVISLPIIDDEVSTPLPGERFYVELYAAGCAPLGLARMLVTITDNDLVGNLSLIPFLQVYSNDEFVMIPVRRVGGSSTPVTLRYFTSAIEGSVAGQHFTQVNGTLIWLHDKIQTEMVRVDIPQGVWWNGLQYSKKFLFQVSYVIGTTMLGNLFSTTIEILDSQSSPGVIGFEPKFECRAGHNAPSGNCYYFAEGEKDARLVVTRTHGLVGRVSVLYASTNLTATSYDDVQLVSGVLTWEQGDNLPKQIIIPILNDTTGPLVEYVKIELFDEDGEVSVLNPMFAVAYVAVVDRDGVGTVQVRSQKTVSWEMDAMANFTVNRVGGALGDISCLVETVPLEALAKIDFVPVSQRISWVDGDMSSRPFIVPLIDDKHYRFGSFFKGFEVKIIECSNTTFVNPKYDSVRVAIADDDAIPGYASFSGIDYDPFTRKLSGSRTATSLVGDAFVTLSVTRKGGLQGNLTAYYRTVNGSAIHGRDFSAVNGKLTWLEGDVSDKHISIPILSPPIPPDPTFDPDTDFSVVLESQSIYSGSFVQPLLESIPQITANIVIEETRGKGFFRFERLEYNVSENDDRVKLTVQRVGGREGAATIDWYTIRDNTATTKRADAQGKVFPTSCANLAASGIRSVMTKNYDEIQKEYEVREVYCDMSQDSVQGSASIFHWDESTVVYDRTCVAADSWMGDMDNIIMWADFTARIGSGTAGLTFGSDYSSWQAYPSFQAKTKLDFYDQQRPLSLGNRARPVPFPVNKRVVWFDWENRTIVWKNSLKTERNISFKSVGIHGSGGMDNIANNFYFITDGLNMVHVGNPSNITLNATLLTFDWTHDTAQAVQAQPMRLQDWCTPDYDAFGHVLWTVNGRVMYKDCSSSGLQVVLGGPIQTPMALHDAFSFSSCPDGIPGCEGWDIADTTLNGGVDLFAHVDASGFLYFGDRGQSGGQYGCSNALKPFGVVRTNIELGRRVLNDFVPSKGSLTWANGEYSTKEISVAVVKDGTRDDSLYEKFSVEIKDSVPTSIIRALRKAVVTIYDVDGAGVVSIVPDASIVSERGECCNYCYGPERDRHWCSHFYVKRSFGRGPMCVDYGLKAVQDATMQLNFSLENDGILSAYTGIHVEDLNGTICWGHNDTTTHSLAIRFPLHLSFDHFHKRFAVELSSPASTSLLAALPSAGPAAPVVKARATQIIEDKDALSGYFTLDTDPASGFATFAYTTESGSAQLSVERFDGSDLDVTVDYSTEELLQSEGGILIPFAQEVVDGSNGSDSFCMANNPRSTGACVDSSSALRCREGFCYILQKKPAKPAIATSQYVSPPADALFIRTTGQLRWKQGEDGKKPITIPILSPPENGTLTSPNPYPLPAFRLVISNVKTSQVGLGASIHLPPHLPGLNVFGSCSSDICGATAPGSRIASCDTDSCRRSETREALIVLEPEKTAGQLKLVNSSYFIKENIQPNYFVLAVKREFGKYGMVTVNFTCTPQAVENVSVAALEGVEFVPVNGQLQWEDGDIRDKYIRVPIIDDSGYIKGRSKRSFRTTLHAATGSAVIDSDGQKATLIIVDDDANPGVVVFRNSLQSVSESLAAATIEVVRIGGDDLDIYAEFSTGQKNSWAAVFEQTVNASAHPRALVRETYACATTLDRCVLFMYLFSTNSPAY